MTTDSRMEEAREFLASSYGTNPEPECATEVRLLQGVVAYAEERLRVNLGLLAENATLKRQRDGATTEVDLSSVDDADLLAEVKRRVVQQR